MKKHRDLAILLLRLATAVNFLSPVGSRLGWWGAGWQPFLQYTAEVNSYAPPAAVPYLGGTATALEIVLSLLLLVGWQTRWAALGAAGLTLLFALAMTYSFGVKEALNYSVFVDSASAFLLATVPAYRWSLDARLARDKECESRSADVGAASSG